jgi:VWFA-related protein
MNRGLTVGSLALALALGATESAPRAQQQAPVFRAVREMVLVDVVVRDRSGAVVKGLTANDFEVLEDGRPQQVLQFSYQELKRDATAIASKALLGDVESRVLTGAPPATAKPAAPAASAASAPADKKPEAPPLEDPKKFSSDELAGRRLMILLFDTSSMQPEDIQRSIDSAKKYVDEKMTPADLIAVATISTTLDVLTDFTGDRKKVSEVLNKLAYTDGTATPPPDASTLATDELLNSDDATTTSDTSELDMFNNDVRLRAIRTLAESLTSIEQKKAIVYFSAGMQRSGSDNQVELRAAVNAAVRANVSLYTVDTRGLQAIVPGGDATGGGGSRGGGGGGGRGGGGNRGLFSGAAVAQQFASLASSQDTLTTLAANTGGQSFTDSNDFGVAFERIDRDMSAYYILGYSSANSARDGRFRRIQVRVKKDALRVEARAGYYAERDFAHTARTDRETQLQDQLFSAVSATDLPVFATAEFFRMSAEKYYVSVSLAVPGAAVPVPPGKDKVTLDVLGMLFDEMGQPVGRIRQTMTLPAGTEKTLAGKQILYESGMTLPPGRFGLKVVVRENETGLTGTYEAPVRVPQLAQAAMKVSSVVLSTQLQAAPKTKTDNPLVREGVQLLPNLTHVVGRDQKLYFYYEVYDPAIAAGKGPELRTSLAFYRGKVKVMETSVVVRSTIDAGDRNAALFQFEVPADKFTPGLYTCQINIIDEVAGNFAFPRVDLLIR